MGEARLFCDCLHEGFHEWPPSFQPIRIRKYEEEEVRSSGDGLDQGEILGE
jgi:hypothetical protein